MPSNDPGPIGFVFVTLNDGPGIHFQFTGTGGSGITLVGQAGDDTFSVTGRANWGIRNMTVFGGPPDGQRLPPRDRNRPVRQGDGRLDLVTGSGDLAQVVKFDGHDLREVSRFPVPDLSYHDGIRVGTFAWNGDGWDELLLGAGPGSDAPVQIGKG